MSNSDRPKPGPPKHVTVAVNAMAETSIESQDNVLASEMYKAESRLASFAKLTADWQTHQKSYLDNFIDFVLGAIAALDLQSATPAQLTEAVAKTYGLHFPETVVHQIARRAAKRGELRNIGSGQYVANEDVLAKARSHSSTVQVLEREQAKIARDFSAWAKQLHGVDVDSSHASQWLLTYVETYYGTLMSASTGRGSIRKLPAVDPDDQTRMVAAFITQLAESEPQGFQYLLNIARGSMLAASLFSPGVPLEERAFKDTTVLLDTRILLRLLGYEGDPARSATIDYLALAAAQGAALGCFDFTLGETRSILQSAELAAQHGKLWSWGPGSVGSYFFNNGLSVGDITLAIGRLRETIERAGIEIVDSPSYQNVQHVVDEDEVANQIRQLSLNYSERALVHDVKALSAIVRMRDGRAKNSLEECRAVFVTTNSNVLRASRRVEDMRAEPWFVAILDTDLATLTWIKTPPSAPDLPKGSLIATCLSVLNPSELMWSKYVREFERRHDAGDISDAELLLARSMTEQSRVAISIHQIDSDEFVAASVDMTIAEARAAVAADLSQPHLERERELLDEIEEQKAARVAIENDLDLIRAEIDATRMRGVTAAHDSAKRQALLVSVMLWSVAIIFVVVIPLIPAISPPFAVVARVIGGVVALTGGAGSLIAPLRHRLFSGLLAAELRKRGLTSDDIPSGN